MRLLAAALLIPFAAAAQVAPEFQATGEVVFRGTSALSTRASYDDARIIGPVVNLEQNEGGGWIGDIGGNAVDRAATKLSGHAGDCSFGLTLESPGLYTGNIGCSLGKQIPRTARAEMRFGGTAAEPRPPLPQFPLAIVSVLPL